MLRIEFSISTAEDAARAARIAAFIAADMDGEASAPADTAASPARARRTRTPNRTSDPAEQYEALKARAETAASAETTEPLAQPAEAAGDARSREELLQAIRETAQDRGALWLRPILQQFKVQKLSDLADEQIRAVLADPDSAGAA